MRMDKAKLCLVGCGKNAGNHMRHLQDFHDIEVAGFCDTQQERAEAFARQYGGRAYAHVCAMYDAEKPDMVFIVVPPFCHGDIEFETIRRGIPMFVEKPVSNDLGQALEIACRVKESGLITAAGFQCRYSGFNAAVQSFISRHPIAMISGSRVGKVPPMPWWRERSKSGGQIVEQAIHQLDLLRFLIGEPETVYSVARQGIVGPDEYPGYDIDDLSATVVTFKNGVVATFTAGVYALGGEAWDSTMLLGARDARVEYNLLSHAAVYGPGEGQRETHHAANDPARDCARAFVDAVLSGDGSAILSPYKDAVKSLAFALATTESVETGVPVRVDSLYQ